MDAARSKDATRSREREAPRAKEPAGADDAPRPDDVPRQKAGADGVPRPKEAVIASGSAVRFGGLQLSDTMLAALDKAGYTEPTPIQKGLIPRAMGDVDLLGQAQTGTGKTAAFAIPILEKVQPHGRSHQPQAIILVPTRELAVQVRDEFVKLAVGRRLHIHAIYGGKPLRQQTEQLRRGVDIVVGTPGRLLDHIERRTLSLASISIAVLDEADRMLDIGFRPDIEKLLRNCPESRQTLLFSATIPPPVLRLAQRYMREPELLDFSPKDIGVETIEQFYFTVTQENKFVLLVHLFKKEEPRQAIVFCRTRRGTEKIHQRLSRRFPSVGAIHGDLPQNVRDRVMSDFRKGDLRILVATDVVGRGIDVTAISHIVNYDVPAFCDDYVHRVGRTGRMGREGIAFTFITPEEGGELTRIEMRINRLLIRREASEFGDLPSPELKASVAGPDPASRDAAAEDSAEATSRAANRKPIFGRKVHRLRRAL